MAHLIQLIKQGKYTNFTFISLFARDENISDAHEVFNKIRNDGNQSEVLYRHYLGFLARKGDMEGMKRGMKLANIDGIKSSLEWKSIYLQYFAHNKDTKSMDEILSSLSSSKTFGLLDPRAIEYTAKMAPSKEFLERLHKCWKDTPLYHSHNCFLASAFVTQSTVVKAFDVGLQTCGTLASLDENLRDPIYNSFVLGLIKADELVKAENFMDVMELQPNRIICNRFIHAYAVKWNLEKVVYWMEIMNQHGFQKDQYTFNPLIDTAIKRNDTKMAKFFLQEMKEVGAQPTAYTYNSMIQSSLEQPEKLESKLEEMLNLGIQPNDITFKIVIGAAIKKGMVELVDHYLDLFKKMGLAPTLDNYESVSIVAGRMKNWKIFNNCIKAMKEEGMSPKRAYHIILENEMKEPDSEHDFELLDRMLADGVAPSEELCNLFISKAAKMGRDSQIVRWVDYIRENEFKLDERGYNALIHRASEVNNFKVAESWLRRMEKENVKPSLLIYNTLIKAAIMAGDNLKIVHWMQQMRKAGIKLDAITYNLIINNAVKVGDLDRALDYLQIMRQQGFKTSTLTFAPALRDAVVKGEEEKWLNELEKEGLPMDEIVYVSLIKGASLAKDIQKAERWIKEMKERGVEVGNGNYSVLADCASEMGDFEGAIRYIERMETFDSTTKRTLLRMLQIVKDRNKEIHEKTFLKAVQARSTKDACAMLLDAWRK